MQRYRSASRHAIWSHREDGLAGRASQNLGGFSLDGFDPRSDSLQEVRLPGDSSPIQVDGLDISNPITIQSPLFTPPSPPTDQLANLDGGDATGGGIGERSG